MKLDIEFVRAQFPAFSEPSLRGKAFFENAGGSYTCRQVMWRLNRFYRERKVQPYGAFAASRIGGDEMDEARTRLARMLGVQTDEISFGPSTSQNTYVLAQAFAGWLAPGDVVVVTNQDHEANSGVWRRLEERGVEVREWCMDPSTGHLDIADLDPLLDERAKLLCFPHCSNVIGEINPVAQITRLARARGVYTCVDGVSYAPHGIPNLPQLGADIYLFSAYKTWGPHIGVMYVRRNLALQLPSQAHYFNADKLHKRFTPAGEDHAQEAAMAGVADYNDAIYSHHFKAGRDGTGRAACVSDLFREAETQLMVPLLDYIATRKDVRLLGPSSATSRAPTLALECQEPGEEVAKRLAPLGILAGGGEFYAHRALEGVGVDPAKGVLRLSFVHNATVDEVDRLITALDQVL
ncbi:MAG: aminotransferase class V-fold PLP-dependent enzyme [Pseudomonadota bacterium]